MRINSTQYNTQEGSDDFKGVILWSKESTFTSTGTSDTFSVSINDFFRQGLWMVVQYQGSSKEYMGSFFVNRVGAGVAISSAFAEANVGGVALTATVSGTNISLAFTNGVAGSTATARFIRMK